MAVRQPSAALNWCFTLNNPTSPIDFSTFDPAVEYAVYQLEHAPNTGTPHYQGFVRYTRPIRLTATRRHIPGAHWETARGTAQENKDYCTKEESRAPDTTPTEYGTFPALQRGKRSDWDTIKEMAKRNASDLEIAEDFPGQYVRNNAGIKKLKGLYIPPRTTMPTVHVIIGPPGTGKSHYAREKAPLAYWKAPNNKWWDFYDSQPSVVLDEFKGWLPYNDLNRLCDKYDYRVEVKGAVVPAPVTEVIILSNYHPSQWYDQERIMFASFQRRVSKWSIYWAIDNHQDFDDFDAFTAAWEAAGFSTAPHTIINGNSAHSSTFRI